MAQSAIDNAPQPLIEKSIELTWSEQWETRNLETKRVFVSDKGEIAQFYFGAAGRIFSRRAINQNFKGGKSFKVEVVDFSASAAPISAYTRVKFEGQTMDASRNVGNGLMRLLIKFSEDYKTCTATGKLEFSDDGLPMIFPAPQSGKPIQTLSMKVGKIDCAVKAENIFKSG